MHYIIDGYNLLFHLIADGETLQSDREIFVSELNEKVQLLKLDVTIVFDGHFRYGLGSRSHMNRLEIRFTDHEESADDFIVSELESSSNPRNETVVTNDNRLAWRVRQRHSKTVKIDRFISWLNSQFKKKATNPKKSYTPHPKPPPPQHEVTVTDEDFNFYLQEFEKRFRKNFKGDTLPKKKPISEVDRWEKIFEERLNNEEEN